MLKKRLKKKLAQIEIEWLEITEALVKAVYKQDEDLKKKLWLRYREFQRQHRDTKNRIQELIQEESFNFEHVAHNWVVLLGIILGVLSILGNFFFF